MLKVGLIGCGFMGGMHAACYNVLEGVKLCAVADVRPEKTAEMKEKYGVEEIYATGKALLEKADVDIIDICLPTFLHAEHAELAMRKVKNVLIEKPVCLTKEEGERLLALEKETGAKIQVGQVVRFCGEYTFLKEALDNGTYGKMHSAVFRRLSSLPTWGWENWLHKPEMSGSVALDLHVHDVDFIRLLLGEPDAFTSAADRNEEGAITQIFTTYQYGEKVVTCEGVWDLPDDFPFEESYRVKFDKATIVYDVNSGVFVYKNGGGVEKIEIAPAYEGENDIGGNISDLGGYYSEIKYMLEKISAGEELTVAPLSEAVKSVGLALDEIAYVGGAKL